MKRRVMVALSGGVDSAVAASILKSQGFEVAGATMSLGIQTNEAGTSRSCILKGVEDARRVCLALGIDHHILDLAPELERYVIEPFIREYGMGRTPNPCMECNRHVKFGSLLKMALSMGFDFFATGHYAGIERANGNCRLIRAQDTRKDQTYFLSGIARNSLEHVLFPLAGLTKDQVREIALKERLPVASKPESQDICFIPKGGTGNFLKERLSASPGDIVDTTGKIMGSHKGIASYTIGQRARLSMSRGKVFYVIAKDIPANRIIIGERDLLLSSGLFADSLNLLVDDLPGRAYAKIRYAHTPAACRVALRDGGIVVLFDEPQEAVTPGQTVALYDSDTVLASGIIATGLSRDESLP